MNITSKQLIGLLVQTQSGLSLGHIKDLEINSDTGQVAKFIISDSNLVKQILEKDLVIGWSQVIEIDEDKMIVEDTTVKEKGFVSSPVSA